MAAIEGVSDGVLIAVIGGVVSIVTAYFALRGKVADKPKEAVISAADFSALNGAMADLNDRTTKALEGAEERLERALKRIAELEAEKRQLHDELNELRGRVTALEG